MTILNNSFVVIAFSASRQQRKCFGGKEMGQLAKSHLQVVRCFEPLPFHVKSVHVIVLQLSVGVCRTETARLGLGPIAIL